MKKNFFKKLSFVLAGAMVLSTLTPASGAFAAKAPKLNSTSKYLHLGREKENEYNFNVSNKKSGWKYEWTSANEDVVKVDKKNGVAKATGVGSTKVSVVITDKDGEEVDELKAKVTVRDNIATVKISNPLTESLAVGAEHDFNRSFFTESGSTKKTSSITRWTVDSEKATINEKGVFVATEAGEYTVTARSFQSKAKYESWLTDAEKYAGYVNATDSTKVTVAASMVGAKQADLNTFKLTFNSPITDAADKITVSQLVGDTLMKQPIEKVSMDAENKVATVDMYADFAQGSTYVIEYPDMEKVTFTAVTVKPEEVNEVKVKTTQAQVDKDTKIEVELLNKDGVNITTDELLTRMTYETSTDTVMLSDNVLSMFKIGETTQITATFHSYDFDGSNGQERNNKVGVGVVRCVEEVIDTVGNIKAYTVAGKDDTPDFKDTNTKVAADDMNKRIYVQARMNAADVDDFDFDNTDPTYGYLFTFKSSNADVLIVNSESGVLYPVKAGSASVIVSYDEKVIGAVTVTVSSERKLATIKLDTNSFVLSNGIADAKEVGLTVKDQYGDDYSEFSVNVECKSAPYIGKDSKNSKDDILAVDYDNTTAPVKFESLGKTDGTYSYEVAVSDTKHDKISMTTRITVQVKEPKGDVSYYAVETDAATYDMKLTSGNDYKVPTVNVKVFGYDKYGVKKTVESSDIVTFAKKPTATGNQIAITNESVSGGAIKLVTTASGEAIKKAPEGYYVLQATVDGKTARNASFRVTDSQPVPSVKVDKVYTYKATAEEAIRDCVTVTINGKTVADEDIFIDRSKGDLGIDTDKQVYVKRIRYNEKIENKEGKNAGYIEHVINLGKTIYYNN